jgi:hypothetical protein
MHCPHIFLDCHPVSIRPLDMWREQIEQNRRHAATRPWLPVAIAKCCLTEFPRALDCERAV